MNKYILKSFTSIIMVTIIILSIINHRSNINLTRNGMFVEAVGNRTRSNSSTSSSSTSRSFTPTANETPSQTNRSASVTKSSTKTATITETRSKTFISRTRSATKTSTRSESESMTRTSSGSVSRSGTRTTSKTLVSKTPSSTKTKSCSGTATSAASETFSLSNSSTKTPSSSLSSGITSSNSSTQSSLNSETVTITGSPSAAATGSVSRSESSSKSVSAAASASISPSRSFSASISPTAALSQTRSDTLSLTQSNTSSESASKTFSLSTSLSLSPTNDESSSITPTSALTESVTSSISDAASQSATKTLVSKTPSPTRTKSDSDTITDTESKTLSFSNSAAKTLSSSPSSEITSTPSSTPSPSTSETVTRSASPSATATPDESQTVSLSRSESGSESVSAAASASISSSHSASSSNSFTVSLSETPNDTVSLTTTESNSESASKTFSLSTSSSPSPTNEESASITPTSALTESITSSISFTASESVSASTSVSPSIIATLSGSESRSINESLSLIETLSRTVSISKSSSPAESSSVTMSADRSMSATQSITDTKSETISISESPSSSSTISAADSISSTSTQTESGSISSTVSSTSSQSETETDSVSLTASPAVSESASLTETKSISQSSSSSMTPDVSASVSLSQSKSFASRSRSPSISLSDSNAKTVSQSVSLVPPDATTRYCELFSESSIRQTDTATSILRSNLFDPYQYAPCCQTANGGELDIIAPEVDLKLRPSVASCYAQLSNCTNAIRPNTFSNSSKLSAKNFSFVDCGGFPNSSNYIGLGKCVDAMVTCLLRASLTVYSQPFSRCPWAPGMLASATLFRGIPSDQRGGLLITQDCIAFKKTIFGAATNCPSANFLSSCSDAIIAAGSVARIDFADFSLDFAAKGIPGALRYGMTMRSPTCGNVSGTCFSPQSSASSLCSCPLAAKRFVGYGPEIAFVASTNCWSHPVQLDFCRDSVDANNVVTDIDFFVQTAPKDAILDNPVFPGFFNASSGSLGSSRRAQGALECLQGHSLLSSCGCPQTTYFRRFLLPAPRALDGRVTRRWVTFCAPIETNIFIIDQGDGACYQPLLKSTQVRGNFSCSCLAGSTSRTVPLAYINESTGDLGPGMLVICDQPPINFDVAQVVATAISALSGLIGGPAMALLQAAVITTLVDCNSDGSSSANDNNALLPFSIGSGVLSSWLTVVVGMALIVILQLLLVVGFFIWRRLKVKEADLSYEQELKKQQEMELRQHQDEDDEEYYYDEEEEEEVETGDDEKDDDDKHVHKGKNNSSQKEASTSLEFSENPLASDPRKSPANSLKRRNSGIEPHRRISRRNSFNPHSPIENINNNNNNSHDDDKFNGSVTEIPASSDADSVFSTRSVAAKKNEEAKDIHYNTDDVIDHGEVAVVKSNENNINSINTSANQTPLERSHSLSIPPTPQTNNTVTEDEGLQQKDQSPANPAVIAPFSPSSSSSTMVKNNNKEAREKSDGKRRRNSSTDFLSPRAPHEQEHDQFFASVNEGSGPSSVVVSNNLMGDSDNNNSLKFQGSRKKSVIFLSPASSNHNKNTSDNKGEMPDGDDENHHQQEQQQPLECLESFSRPGPSIHFIDPPPDDIEMPPIITRTVYKAIPAPFPGEEALDSFMFACCMARFPYVSMLFGRLVFQGFAYDTVLLLARNPVGSVNGIAGGFGVVLCLGWTFSHLYLANHIQRFEVWVYREYVRAFDTLPKFVPRRVLPHGFWHNSPFLLAFRATVDLYVGNQKMLRHLSWFTYFRMIVIGIIVGVPASKENCIGVYVALLVIMWVSAIIFIAFRPHRRPIDDVINVLLSFLNGLMIIFIIQPTLGDANNIFLAIVYSALASMAFTFIYAACEFFWWNRVEVRVSEAHESKSIEQDKEAREDEIERRYDELDRWRELWEESEALALEFEAEERKMRKKVAKLERSARARVTFSTDADEARDQTQAARARRFSSVSAGGISAEEARTESLNKRKMSINTKNNNNNNNQGLPSDEGEKMSRIMEPEDGDEGDDADDEVDETASTSTTTSLQAIRRMRMALRNKRSSIRFEGGDSTSFNFSGIPGENNNNNLENGEEVHSGLRGGSAVRRRRFAQAPAPAERARLAVADLQTDMSDAFAHRALDVLGFF